MADLVRRSGIEAGQAWAWPLIVDGIIVVATVSVVALAGQRGAWYPWMLLAAGAIVSVTANALHAVVAADADVPGVLAASVAAVPPLVLLAITHLTVILTRPLPATEATTTTYEETAPEEHPAGEAVALRLAESSRLQPTPTPDEAPEEPPQRGESVPGPRAGNAGGGRREVATELRGQGWSNKRIARHLGVHPSTVGRWFTSDGARSLSPGWLDHLPHLV